MIVAWNEFEGKRLSSEEAEKFLDFLPKKSNSILKTEQVSPKEFATGMQMNCFREVTNEGRLG